MEKGYGFIEREDKEKDVFVHASAVKLGLRFLNEGDEITFEVEDGEKAAVKLQNLLILIHHYCIGV